MSPRELSDIEIMQRFLKVTEDLGAIREGNARIEEKVDTLTAARPRCDDHAVRLRNVENSVSKLSHTFKVVAWIAGFVVSVLGVAVAVIGIMG